MPQVFDDPRGQTPTSSRRPRRRLSAPAAPDSQKLQSENKGLPSRIPSSAKIRMDRARRGKWRPARPAHDASGSGDHPRERGRAFLLVPTWPPPISPRDCREEATWARIVKICRRLGVSEASLYRWKKVYADRRSLACRRKGEQKRAYPPLHRRPSDCWKNRSQRLPGIGRRKLCSAEAHGGDHHVVLGQHEAELTACACGEVHGARCARRAA